MTKPKAKTYKNPLIKIIILTLCAITLIASGTGALLLFTRDTSPIPAQIRSQLTFSPFVLPNNSGYVTTDYKFNAAEDKVHILSYLVTSKDVTVSVSEYTQPPEFTDIPEYKDRFLSNIAKQYDTVQTSNGAIYLGRQALQNNKQLGVMIERGLLVFMSPDKDLDSTQWRSLGDQLEIQKIKN